MITPTQRQAFTGCFAFEDTYVVRGEGRDLCQGRIGRGSGSEGG